MKKTVFLMLVALLLVLSAVALAATAWYVKTPNGKTVNIRHDQTGEVIGHIPYGTAVYPTEESTETAACVTYNGVTGYVSWKYLVKDKPAAYKAASSSKKQTAVEEEPYGEGEYEVTVTGGVLQFPNKKGKASGTKYLTVKFDEPVDLVVTASVPRGKKIAYWLVNGVKLKLTAKSLGITGDGQDVSVEIVFK